MSTYRTNRPLRIVATIILVTALLTACKSGSTGSSRTAVNHDAIVAHVAPTGATAPVGAKAWASADRLTAAEFTADTTDAVRAGLAASGIGTYADTNATAPERPVTGPLSAFRLLDFQTHALAVGAWADSGFTGAELDMVLPLPAGATGEPTTSQLLAAYVGAADTPGGALSRALMAGQNLLAPTDLRFPALVLVLFAADLAHVGNAGAPTDAAYTMVATGICSATANWINGMISSFFGALRLATPDNVPLAIITSIWNWLVDVGQALVNSLIKAVTDAVLGTIRSIAATIAATAEQIASLLPYAVKVTAGGGGGATFQLGPDPLPGTFTAQVTAGDLPDWPPVLRDCASVAKVALPDFHSKEKPLTWGPLSAPANPLLAPTGAAHNTDITDATGQAVWPFFTSADPGDPHGEQLNQVDAMPVAVHRPELDAARDRLTKALLGAIPSILQPFAAALFAPYISGLQSRLNTLLDARGTGTAILVFHDGTPPTPKPTPTNKPSNSCGAAPGAYTGTFTNDSTETIVISNGGKTVDTNDGTGPVTLTVAADGSTTGTWSEKMHEVFNEHIDLTDFEYHRVVTWSIAGTFTGTACNLGLTSTPLVMLSCVVNRGTCENQTPPMSGTLPSLGPPASSSAGHLVWTWKYHTDDSLTVDDLLTISVSS